MAEKRRSVEALRRSNEFSRIILDSMNDAVSIIDIHNFRIVSVNSTFLRELGLKEDEILGRTCYETTHHLSAPCSTSGHICPLMDTRITGMHAVTEHVHFRKNGEKIFVEVSASPIRDENGEVIQVVHVSRDITDRKITEEALRESEERFRRMFEQHEDALFIFKPETCEVIDANPASVNLYGYTREEFIGRDISLFLESTDYRRCIQAIGDIESTNNAVCIDQMINIKKDGTRIIVSVRGKVITLKERNVLYCSFRDITEKKRLEEEAGFIQSKLIQANKMTSLGTLVSGVAHEINNPNNFIMFNTQLLTEAWQDVIRVLTEYYHENGDISIGGLPFSEMRGIIPKLLSGITDGSHRIKNIVDTLKDFARQDSAGLDSQVNINDIITVSSSILSNQIKRNTEKFHLVFDDTLPAVKGNAQQLEQVIINLIINALQALPDKTHGIRISTSFDGESGCVTIKVRDEGRGMSGEVLERIMEPFFTTRIEQGGTGLGLSISYSIIKDHHGSLTFESEPGRGTTASVMLPAVSDG